MSRELKRRAEVAVIREEAPTLGDCEVRDFEAFSQLPPTLQSAVLDAIRSGVVPSELKPLFLRLKEAGVLVCT